VTPAWSTAEAHIRQAAWVAHVPQSSMVVGDAHDAVPVDVPVSVPVLPLDALVLLLALTVTEVGSPPAPSGPFVVLAAHAAATTAAATAAPVGLIFMRTSESRIIARPGSEIYPRPARRGGRDRVGDSYIGRGLQTLKRFFTRSTQAEMASQAESSPAQVPLPLVAQVWQVSQAVLVASTSQASALGGAAAQAGKEAPLQEL
jgi:hypothetical protein